VGSASDSIIVDRWLSAVSSNPSKNSCCFLE